MNGRRYKPVGWRGESYRHYLAAKGIKTNRRYMAYNPTYTGADLPLIAGDALGTAGAATVSLIPLAVTAGVLYGGARGIKRKSEGKSFFAQDPRITDDDLLEGKSKQLLERWGFDESRTLVHGTSLENAKKILEQQQITGGTWVPPTRGGFVDAQVWAQNTYGDDAVVIVAETDEQWGRDALSPNWVTFGDRAKEREGTDMTADSARITNIKVFRPSQSEARSRVDMMEGLGE